MATLIDTALLLDLLLMWQPAGQRLRSISASARAAIETLLFHDDVRCDSESLTRFVTGFSTGGRFRAYLCGDDIELQKNADRFAPMIQPMPVAADKNEVKTYRDAVLGLSATLQSIIDLDSLRAFELFDLVPYHLGEDSTVLEFGIDCNTNADLSELPPLVPFGLNRIVSDYAAILSRKGFPTRAAWTLPLLRLAYYQVIQCRDGLNFVPHLTKSTLLFGRSDDFPGCRRLVQYSSDVVQEDFATRTDEIFGAPSIMIPLPGLVYEILMECRSFDQMIDRIQILRARTDVAELRTILATLSRGTCNLASVERERLIQGVQSFVTRYDNPRLPIDRRRSVIITVPLFFEEHLSVHQDAIDADANRSRVYIYNSL